MTYERLLRKPKPAPEKVNVTSTANGTDANATTDGNNTIHVNVTGADENATEAAAEPEGTEGEKKEETKEAGEDEL